jgi:hypothetical protein
MKKCPECQRELDKNGYACQYCGKVDEVRAKAKNWREKIQRLFKPRKPNG